MSLCHDTDENYDKMRTILEPDDSRSYTSPTPSSEDIQEGTLTKGGGQEGSHFKKRKPMKTTSRGSMRKLMDNMMEHDQDDRQVSTSVVIEMRIRKDSHFWINFD